MEIKLYFRMLQRGWWIIVLTALIALSASLTVSYFAVPQYKVTARFIITPGSFLTSEGDPEAVIAGLETLDLPSVVATYTEVMNSQRILNEALSYLGVTEFVPLDYAINAVALPKSSVLELNVLGPDPVLTADLTNAIGYETILYTRRINRIYDFDFLDHAIAPTAPISPKPLRDAGLSLMLGLVAGAVLAILSEQLRIPLEAYRQRMRLDMDTEVYNYRYFIRLVEDKLAEKPSDVHSIGIVELSGLEELSGTLPSQGLQRVLRSITDRLRKELRGNDVIGRWSDEGFIVMLPLTTGESATTIFTRIYESLKVPVNLPQYGTKINLDPCVGGAQYSNNIASSELLEKAEQALEESRRSESKPVYIWTLKNPFWV